MRYIFILTILFSVFYSCSEDKLDTYDAERYIYFSNTSADTIVAVSYTHLTLPTRVAV